MKLLQRAKNQKGFTLVELMVVVVIIGILVAIAVPVYNKTQENAKDNANDANVRIIEGAVSFYITENGIPENKTLDISTLISEGYLAKEPESPYKDDKVYKISFGEEGDEEMFKVELLEDTE